MLAELEGPLLARMTPDEMKAVQRYTQLATTSLWLTDGDVLQGQSPEKSLVFGLAKAVMTEQPSFHLRSLDINLASKNCECSNAVMLIVEMEIEFHRNPLADMDNELVVKDDLVYISRYVSDSTENSGFECHSTIKTALSYILQGSHALTLRFEKVGETESFFFDRQELKSLAEGEILLDVEAVPLSPLVRENLGLCGIENILMTPVYRYLKG